MVSVEPLVLIVDDETPIRRFLRLSLAGEGYRVIEAGTAAEALEMIAGQRPDVVILDLGLPDRDGLDLTRDVREWSSVPIVVLSAREKENDKVAALEAGADDYLTKPFGTGELMARLRVAESLRREGTSEYCGTNKTSSYVKATSGNIFINLSSSTCHCERALASAAISYLIVT